ncbi:unnamed protein product [Prorocentrum cordatum]|uniref:LNR domain-containing protein n=1 Tax=Prorocentrum cordatum TaxID=2364126 RepID=A0ABN9Q9T2_9DINO|nr:unnamed protein product [Polarella glacialis]
MCFVSKEVQGVCCQTCAAAMTECNDYNDVLGILEVGSDDCSEVACWGWCSAFGDLCCETCSSGATTTTDNVLCADGCYNGWPGDGYCDSVCYNWEYNYDGGDCDTTPEPEPEPEPEMRWTTTDQELCADGCYNGWPGDGYCDSACYKWECNYDGCDCDTTPEPELEPEMWWTTTDKEPDTCDDDDAALFFFSPTAQCFRGHWLRGCCWHVLRQRRGARRMLPTACCSYDGVQRL